MHRTRQERNSKITHYPCMHTPRLRCCRSASSAVLGQICSRKRWVCCAAAQTAASFFGDMVLRSNYFTKYTTTALCLGLLHACTLPMRRMCHPCSPHTHLCTCALLQFVEELSRLQDRVPAFPADKAESIIEQELGRPVNQVFRSFERTPIAAASLGQVSCPLVCRLRTRCCRLQHLIDSVTNVINDSTLLCTHKFMLQ